MPNPLDFHPYANVFPLLEGEDFLAIVEDIRANGLQQRITVDSENLILDGRNRYRACLESGIVPDFETYSGNNPLQFVISRNLHRRHLDESQRSVVAVKIANIKFGDNQFTDHGPADMPTPGISQSTAAQMLNVSERSVRNAAAIRDRGSPELWESVQAGVLPVSTAAELVAAPVEIQQQAIADPKRAHTLAKQYRRSERETELSDATARASEKIGNQLYSVICADPPWRWEPYSRITGMDRSADNHYPTMTVNLIKALKVPSATHSVLFLWARADMLTEALDVMKAWGFTYKSQAIWAKDKLGPGYWFRSKHELLLVGTKGDIPAPAPGTQYDSVISAPAHEHSVKPLVFFDMIETLYPHQLPLEMFARGEPRPGWDQWGNEAQVAYSPRSIGEERFDVPIPDEALRRTSDEDPEE